jgi:4-methylaminobutanoate oxidase (formaldehyde-forming)
MRFTLGSALGGVLARTASLSAPSLPALPSRALGGARPALARAASSSLSSSLPAPAAEPALPAHARVVIVGGGIIGNSIAYHLAKLGWSDVLLLERDRLTSGTTWHSAGLVCTFGSLSETSTSWRRYSRELYASLEAETGQATGFLPVGFIELAADADRLVEYRRIAAINRLHGVDVHEISAREVAALAPLTRVDDVLAGFYTPGDGRVNPVDAAMALAKGARMRGARVVEGVAVASVSAAGGRATGVVTEGGQRVRADVVVNAAGMWARQLAAKSGVPLPLQAVEHYYLITDKMPQVDPNTPVVEDPASYAYIRPEAGGMMVGLFEDRAMAWKPEGIPRDASFVTIPPDWERMTPFLTRAMSRVPATLEVGAKLLFCGPESFTHDGAPLIGEVNELRGYFVAAGLNSIGILSGGGVGRCVANWIVNGAPDEDVTAVNVDRASHALCTPAFRAARNPETLEKTYGCHYPALQPKTARGSKRSPLHDALARQGALFKDVSSWEGADYFDASGALSGAPLSWGRAPWFPLWAAEHAAVREAAALIDMSFMAKFLVAGPGAASLLQWLCTADVAGPAVAPGTITYTQLCNARGTLEGDVTVTKLPAGGGCFGGGHALGDADAPPEFLVVATDTAHRHVETWLRRHAAARAAAPGGAFASVTDVSGGVAQVNVQGPRSREVLQRVTDADLSPAAFPFRAARYVDVGLARVLATRITYVGELGYELFVPAEAAAHVCDTLRAAATPAELRHVGLRALGSLRLEKAYRDYGHDLDNCDTLLEAGLGFTADVSKPGGFLGMGRLLEQQAAGGPGALAQRLVQVLCADPAPLMHGREVLLRDGVRVGDVRSASYGHTLGGAVGIAHVRHPQRGGRADKAWLDAGAWQLDVAGRLFPARVSLSPMYDPRNERIR